MNQTQNLTPYLQPAEFINSGHPDIQKFTWQIIKPEMNPIQKAVALYYDIRDRFAYNPYQIDISRPAMQAHVQLQKKNGYCITKACLLAACGRAAQIPSRLGFAIVQNHIGTEKLERILKTNKLVFHGFTEFFLNGQWVKSTPTFDKQLCAKLGVQPLEFDGQSDSIFQQYSIQGSQFMDYLYDYGTFQDIPYELMIQEFRKHYPHLFDSSYMKKNLVFKFS